MFTYSHANTPLGQSERAYYLSYFISYYNSRQQYAYYKLRQRLLQFTIACLLQFSTTVITIYDFYYNLRHITVYDRRHVTFSFSVEITDASKRPIKNLIVAISWRVLKFSCFSKCANKTRSQDFLSMPSSIERNVKI